MVYPFFFQVFDEHNENIVNTPAIDETEQLIFLGTLNKNSLLFCGISWILAVI